MRQFGDVFEDMLRRGLVAQSTPGVEEHLRSPRAVYCGFDPTADSLHIGSLVPLLALRRFLVAGHRPIALIGGATGLVGDPSFKAEERRLNAGETVERWSEAILAQVEQLLSVEQGQVRVVNNLDWLREARMLDFLRDVGKHFSVSAMIRKDSVRQRIERDGEGLSFAEFSYALLQAFDFAELNRRFGCSLQIGGSDQWGNITGGIDLCRRQNRSLVHAITLPLVTKSDGSKFGKTESGTIWLDPGRTSPYAFFQFWMGVSDADVYRYLRQFTFLPPEEIDGMEATSSAGHALQSAQRVLAEEVTGLVHGDIGRRAATRITDALFAGEWTSLAESDFAQLRQDGLPATTLTREMLGMPLTSLFPLVGLGASGKQVKDALARDAVLVNGAAFGQADNLRTAEVLGADRAAYGKYLLARLGKKSFHLFVLGD
jgi:tyrosyl-tRNA synthetase